METEALADHHHLPGTVRALPRAPRRLGCRAGLRRLDGIESALDPGVSSWEVGGGLSWEIPSWVKSPHLPHLKETKASRFLSSASLAMFRSRRVGTNIALQLEH